MDVAGTASAPACREAIVVLRAERHGLIPPARLPRSRRLCAGPRDRLSYTSPDHRIGLATCSANAATEGVWRAQPAYPVRPSRAAQRYRVISCQPLAPSSGAGASRGNRGGQARSAPASEGLRMVGRCRRWRGWKEGRRWPRSRKSVSGLAAASPRVSAGGSTSARMVARIDVGRRRPTDTCPGFANGEATTPPKHGTRNPYRS